jgi:eukaryotic-like serine/threonine-protein kinase
MTGRVVSGYRVLEPLGSGGMGTVYRALDEMLERTVALKVLRPELARQEHLLARFRQEARTLARLLHPNITTLYALAQDGDEMIMVMEYVEGQTLEALVGPGRPLPPAEAVALLAQALDGIAHAHRHGVVHRDLKPANLMRTPEGVVKVMDFGIARLATEGQRLTQTRHTVGTLAYMAPEQIRSQAVDARTDVYATGALLFEVLTGRLPYDAPSDFELMRAHLDAPVPRPSDLAPSVPSPLDDVVMRALAKAPEDRYPSAEALRDALLAAAPAADYAPRPGSRPTPVPGTGPAPPPGSPPSPPPLPALPPSRWRTVSASGPGGPTWGRPSSRSWAWRWPSGRGRG